MVYVKGYERADYSWEPFENLYHSLELIQEFRDANHPAGPTHQITYHYIRASWEPMEVSYTPRTANNCPDDFSKPFNDEQYDSCSSEHHYFPTDDASLLWQTDESAENSEDFGIILDFSE